MSSAHVPRGGANASKHRMEGKDEPGYAPQGRPPDLEPVKPKPKEPPKAATNVQVDDNGRFIEVWLTGPHGTLRRDRAKVWAWDEQAPEPSSTALLVLDTGYGLRILAGTDNGWREAKLTVL